MELWLGVALVAVVLGVWFYNWKRRRDDELLMATFNVTREMARSVLPEQQIEALAAELAGIMQIEKQAVLSGANAQVARRMSLEASVRSMKAHIELNRMMPG